MAGPKGRVLLFRRTNGKSPAEDFLNGCDQKMRPKFNGSFEAVSSMGARYLNSERFKPLQDKGKPLWEFKEHDHRLFCFRKQTGDSVVIVLLNGWVKDKAGRSKEEAREITRAQGVLADFMALHGREM